MMKSFKFFLAISALLISGLLVSGAVTAHSHGGHRGGGGHDWMGSFRIIGAQPDPEVVAPQPIAINAPDAADYQVRAYGEIVRPMPEFSHGGLSRGGSHH